jgi:class 3 adenylate cyclase
VAARLGSVAGPGELLVGAATWDAASPALMPAARRSIPIRGRAADLEVVVVAEAVPANP